MSHETSLPQPLALRPREAAKAEARRRAGDDRLHSGDVPDAVQSVSPSRDGAMHRILAKRIAVVMADRRQSK